MDKYGLCTRSFVWLTTHPHPTEWYSRNKHWVLHRERAQLQLAAIKYFVGRFDDDA